MRQYETYHTGGAGFHPSCGCESCETTKERIVILDVSEMAASMETAVLKTRALLATLRQHHKYAVQDAERRDPPSRESTRLALKAALAEYIRNDPGGDERTFLDWVSDELGVKSAWCAP